MSNSDDGLAEEVGRVQGLLDAASSERGKGIWALAAFATAGGVAVTLLQDLGGYSEGYSAIFAIIAGMTVGLAIMETWNVYTGVYDA